MRIPQSPYHAPRCCKMISNKNSLCGIKTDFPFLAIFVSVHYADGGGGSARGPGRWWLPSRRCLRASAHPSPANTEPTAPFSSNLASREMPSLTQHT